MSTSRTEREADRAMRLTADRALIDRALAGDTTAFDALVRQYQDSLYRLMVRACHHPQDAEEVSLEAFARAYEHLAAFEGRSSFVTWLGRIATNLCFRRREKHELDTVELPSDETLTRADGSASAPESEALRAEMRRILKAAVESLPEPDRTVLKLRDIEQLTAAETSERTGLTIPAVKARLHRSRARLRDLLNGYFLGDASAT